MSVFGTGRREGIIAVCLIAVIVALGHIGSAMRHDTFASISYQTAIFAAVGGMLTYRFLRAQGRSRYAGFLVGAAYGLSPLFAGLALAPREQFAAALAPLALEAVYLCHVASTRRRWLPWVGLCVALPFGAGVTVIATMTTVLALTGFARTIACGDTTDQRGPWRGFLLATVIGATVAANLIWLEALTVWLGPPAAPNALLVLSGGDGQITKLTPTLMLRGLVPFLLWFAVFGTLRLQRHVGKLVWIGLLLLGAGPTILLTVFPALTQAPLLATVPELSAAAWWLSLLALTVLGAAGLDDFLDHPMRRRNAQVVVLFLTLATAVMLPILEAATSRDQWIALATLVLLATTITTLRPLGILRFKNLLSTLVLAACALPLILQTTQPVALPAAPLAEVAAPLWQAVWLQTVERPWWHYAGLAGGLCTAIVLATMSLRRAAIADALRIQRFRRKPSANRTPTAAKPAIKKNAPPAQRS